MKKALLAATIAVTTLAASLAATPTSQSLTGQPVNKAFASGGAIRMELTAGEYKISGRPEEMIRINWRADSAEDVRNLKTDAELRGKSATIVTRGPNNGHGVHYTIDVPSRSDLEINLTAGDLEIRAIEGNKKVESWAGDLSIEVGRPDQYRSVEASVRAGDLNARPFNVSKGGLLRSFSWSGKGAYSLAVKLFAGDLTLR